MIKLPKIKFFLSLYLITSFHPTTEASVVIIREHSGFGHDE